MSSVTSICNIALSNIGKKTISDIDEPSTEARTCKLHYALTRDRLLQSYEWEFAKTMVDLAEVANPRPERWRHAYARPQNCLKPLRIVPAVLLPGDADDVAYHATEGLIFCDQSPAKLEFVRQFDDPARYPPLFEEALSWALSAKIAISLTSDQSTRKDAYQIAASSFEAAKEADADENRSSWTDSSTLMTARG
ncbi:hypothetical protein PVA19_14425 [Agrobacterium sp. CNPSo 3708]|uniref:hypothetical protein n=1 Tax=unclassified Agrobacterium TaxID=2632611 RepID=UPI00236342BC|nr:hypothetical protein [Agrobacterium sp. CNPSo 3708]MDD1499616.1 hypothetical protein [Agrobacterium sp. CNPSo 3708]